MTDLPSLILLSTLTKKEVQFGRPVKQKGSLQISIHGNESNVLPANIVLILDCSGSMRGKPLQLLNMAIEKIAQKLRPEDRLSIIGFGTEAEVIIFEKKKIDLIHGVQDLTILGGTNYKAGLQKALEVLRQNSVTQNLVGEKRHGVAKTILFMSDGHPTDKGWQKLLSQFPPLGFSLHAIGIGDELNPDYLDKMAGDTGGLYEHAKDESELDACLNNLVDLSQNLAYSLPDLQMDVFPRAIISNLKIVGPPRNLLDTVPPGKHTIILPDIQAGTVQELIFDLEITDPGDLGQRQDLIEWSLQGAQSETTFLLWVDEKTSMLAPASTRPIVLTKIFQGFEAIKNNDRKTALNIANTLEKMDNNPLAQTGATIVKDVVKTGDTSSRGKLLSKLSKAKTTPDGKIQ